MPSLLILVPPAIVATATVSGVFGMGGGLLLMAAYAALLPVREAMVLHAVTQLASNGSRCALLLRHVRWAALAPYAAGVAVAFVGCTWAALTLDKATLMLALGAIPLAGAALPRLGWLRFEYAPAGFLCGVVVTVAHLTAGVSGPLLDLFFVKGDLDRFEVIGTKAITQTAAHTLKLVYFARLVPAAGDPLALPVWIYPVAVVCALGGTLLGKRILMRLDDARFRRASTRLIAAIAVLLLARGVWATVTG